MLTSTLLENLEYKLLGDKMSDLDISKLTIDSRKVVDNSCFICIVGLTVDSHNFIQNAIDKGAKLIVVNKDIDMNIVEKNSHCIFIKVEDSRKALSTIAYNFYNKAVDDLRIIGVTGTNGKTSTTYFLESVLKLDNRKCGIIGTSGIIVDGETLDIPFETATTPDAIELHQIFYEMRKLGVTDVLMEVSSHALKLDKVYGINFEVAIFTNLTQDHLDFHGTFDDYVKSKAKLFSMAKHSIINVDDKYAADIIMKCAGTVRTYGIYRNSDFLATEISLFHDRSEFDVAIDGTKFRFVINTPGMFNVYNVLGVVGASYRLGVDINNIIEGVKNIIGIPGRIQSIPNNKGIGVFVDYAHSPDSIENIISAVRQITFGKIITVFGCGGNKDKTKRPIMGKIASDLSDICILTSDNPRNENPEQIISEIETGISSKQCVYYKIVDRKEAIYKAISMAEKDDSVIIAGKGEEDYQEFEDKRRISFDDRLIARSALEDN